MTDTIIEVLTIIPAQDWHFGDAVLDSDKLISDLPPVVCFAMVSTVSPDHLSLGRSKATIPLGINEYSRLDDLLGKDLSEYDSRDIVHRSQIIGSNSDAD